MKDNPKSSSWLVFGPIALSLLLMIGGALFLMLPRSNEGPGNPDSTSSKRELGTSKSDHSSKEDRPGKSSPREKRPKLTKEETQKLLRETILPAVEWENITIAEAIESLNALIREAGIDANDLLITHGRRGDPDNDWLSDRIRELRLRQIPVDALFGFGFDSSKYYVSVGEGVVELRSKEVEPPPPPDPQELAAEEAARERAAEIIRNKLEGIIIPVIDFEETTLEEAIDFLRQRSMQLDPERVPERRGVSLVIRKPHLNGGGAGVDEELDAEGGLGSIDPGSQRMTYQASNQSAWDALNEIAGRAGMRVAIDEFAITLVPIAPAPEGQPANE